MDTFLKCNGNSRLIGLLRSKELLLREHSLDNALCFHIRWACLLGELCFLWGDQLSWLMSLVVTSLCFCKVRPYLIWSTSQCKKKKQRKKNLLVKTIVLKTLNLWRRGPQTPGARTSIGPLSVGWRVPSIRLIKPRLMDWNDMKIQHSSTRLLFLTSWCKVKLDVDQVSRGWPIPTANLRFHGMSWLILAGC